MEISQTLIQKAKQFDESSLEEIFSCFKPFIRSMAFKYFLSGADRDDLIQEGMIGLFNAVKNYDVSKEIPFESFAKRCIVLRLKTVIKNSLRLKHTPLNESVSIESEAVLTDLTIGSPEEEFFNNEDFKIANEKLKAILSKFELSVLYLVNSGMTYREIATVLGKSPKSIDNALQRIKKKAAPLFHL